MKAFWAKNSLTNVASHLMTTLASFWWNLPTQQNHDWFVSCENHLKLNWVVGHVFSSSDPNMDGIVDIEGWWCTKCLVIKHVGRVHTLEVCTTNTFDLGDQHNDDGSHVRSSML